jgi:hypothetical protein
MQSQGLYRRGPAVVEAAVRPLTASKSCVGSRCSSARSPPRPQINDRSRLRAHEASVFYFTSLLMRTGYRGHKCERYWNGYGSTTIGGSPRARKGAAKLGNSSWRRPGTAGFNPVSDRSSHGEDHAYGAAATMPALIRCTVRHFRASIFDTVSVCSWSRQCALRAISASRAALITSLTSPSVATKS